MSFSAVMQEAKQQIKAWMDGNEYQEVQKAVDDYSCVQQLRETRGWRVLQDRLQENMDQLKTDMLMADEPDDPVQAKIWRAERRAFGKAIFLLKDHAELICQHGMDAIEHLNDMGITSIIDE